MRSVEVSPDFRVVRAGTQRPYTTTATAIRQRWRDRAMARSMASSSTTRRRSMASSTTTPSRRIDDSRRRHVESVPDSVFFDHAELLLVIEEGEEGERELEEEREPATAESAPLRYCQEQQTPSSCATTPTTSLTALLLNNGCHSVPGISATDSQLQLANSYYAAMNDKLIAVAEAPTGDSRICLVDVLSNTFDPTPRTERHHPCGQAAPQAPQVAPAQAEVPPMLAILPGAATVVDEQFRTMSIVSVAARSSSRPQQQRRPRPPERLEKKSATATRRRVLMKVLGMQKFYKALALVREGKSIVQDRRRRINIPQSQEAQQDLAVPPTQQQQDQNNASKGETPLEGWPPVAADLVLSLTRLVTALEQTHLPELPKLPWDELLPQLNQNIMAYKEWMSLTESRE